MKPLEVRSLTKLYGSARGVEDSSFAVEPGEIFGYLGPNGSGKTTTIRCIMGLLKPSTGECLILGQRVRVGRATQHARIGYLPGEFRIWPELRARQALDLLGSVGDGDGRGPQREEMAERLELDLDRPMRELSKGNRQKVGVIYALQHRPDLLILDEPTSGLDPLMRQVVLDMIREACRDGATALLSSHDLSEVAATCTRAAILRKGRLVELASIDTIVQQGEKRLKVWFREGEPAPAFPKDLLGGARVIERKSQLLHLAYQGSVDAILKWLAQYRVDRIATPETSLKTPSCNTTATGKAKSRTTRVKKSATHDRERQAAVSLALLRFWLRRALLVWFLLALIIWIIQIYVCRIVHDNETVKALLSFIDLLPAFIKAGLGGEALETGNVSSLLAIGYRDPFVLILFMLFAVGVPSGILTGELQSGTMELILSRPVTRTQVYICACAVTFGGMCGLVLIMFFGTFVGTRIFDFDEPVALGAFFRLAVNSAFLACAVAALSLLAAASMRRRVRVVGVIVAYLVVNYFIAIFAQWWAVMARLEPVTLFYYVDDVKIFASPAWPLRDIAVLATLLLIATLAGAVVWHRRDLPL